MNFEKIVLKIINFFDYFKTKKIYSFLAKKIKKNPVIFDVGAHHGETIILAKNFFLSPEIYSFEISKKNFIVLQKKLNKEKFKKVYIFNFGFSNIPGNSIFNQSLESSSSTISKVNKKSKYFLKKLKILGKNPNNFFEEQICKLERVDDFCKSNNIKKIDLLKIDTEGHELFVLKGAEKLLRKINFIFFEHHYDNMIMKGYNFSDIHHFLLKNNFKKIFKSKMFFRKTFEYIYINNNL